MSPVALFLQADIVVKAVIVGLLARQHLDLGDHRRPCAAGCAASRREQCAASSATSGRPRISTASTRRAASDELPSAKVLAAGIAEWRRSTAGKVVDREGTRSRLAVAMHRRVAAEIDRLAVAAQHPRHGRLGRARSSACSAPSGGSCAASPTSPAPTIPASPSSRPGIAEALFATALGLFAAIPAVIAYNRFSYGINRIEARLQRFADGFHGTLSRELEQWRRSIDGRWAPILGARPARRGATPMAEINVTPMVDVMLVLLIIFMVTAPCSSPASRSTCPTARPARSTRSSEPVADLARPHGAIFVDDAPVAAGRARRPARRRSPPRRASRAARASSCAPTAPSITAG